MRHFARVLRAAGQSLPICPIWRLNAREWNGVECDAGVVPVTCREFMT